MASNNESAYESTCKTANQDGTNQDEHLGEDVVQQSLAAYQAHCVAQTRARLDEDLDEEEAKGESWEWWRTERRKKRKQESEDRACQRSRVRAEAKLAKAATKAQARATPKDDMSAPIGAASNVEGGRARRAPDLEASSVAMEDGYGGGEVQTNAVDKEGSPMTTMARLAIRGGGSGAPVPLGDGVQVKAEPGTRGVVGAPGLGAPSPNLAAAAAAAAASC